MTSKRFIPAGAGNILLTYTKLAKTTVHPRGCGEHSFPLGRTMLQYGSSPRVRGTFVPTGTNNVTIRFIPAGAGNIAQRVSKIHLWAVHPRGCGEHVFGKCFSRGNPGSSPRVRGTCVATRCVERDQRFIPAGAGNILSSMLEVCLFPVHPRGCGEHRAILRKQSLGRGSSPRVRGTCR